jgi:cbb3-type cytochrome oxidase maturation protein
MTTGAGAEMIVYLWVGFLLLMLAGIAGVFWWAVRNRQFSDQERARFLPLESGIPQGKEGEPPPGKEKPGPGDGANRGGKAR